VDIREITVADRIGRLTPGGEPREFPLPDRRPGA